MTVMFNSLDEFCAELRKDLKQEAIERGIVRTASLFRSLPSTPYIRSVHFVATYCVKGSGQLVELDLFCGEHWNHGSESDQRTQERVLNAQACIEKLITELNAQGITVELRSGVLCETGSFAIHASTHDNGKCLSSEEGAIR